MSHLRLDAALAGPREGLHGGNVGFAEDTRAATETDKLRRRAATGAKGRDGVGYRDFRPRSTLRSQQMAPATVDSPPSRPMHQTPSLVYAGAARCVRAGPLPARHAAPAWPLPLAPAAEGPVYTGASLHGVCLSAISHPYSTACPSRRYQEPPIYIFGSAGKMLKSKRRRARAQANDGGGCHCGASLLVIGLLISSPSQSGRGGTANCIKDLHPHTTSPPANV